FDFTASLIGSARVYDFMAQWDKDLYPDGRTPTYPLLYAQITRRFNGFDLYLGGENLMGFTQKSPIVSADFPYSPYFDAASVWGPLMGAKIYAGIRITVWK
ncbi:MAG: TonB-dependent receptor, partial [Bacteroidales bacterium]|nr:TonB-dependent receptor [Bacteroidales bacterium]